MIKKLHQLLVLYLHRILKNVPYAIIKMGIYMILALKTI